MQELSLLMMLLSIGLFLARYLIRKPGVDYLTVIVSVSSAAMLMKDDTLDAGVDFLMVFLPVLFVMMLSISHIAFDKKRF